MQFCDREHVASLIAGKVVAIVGSGPGCNENAKRLVDSHEVVVRVNNFKLMAGTGYRTDIFYSYFGNAVRKTADELKACGVKLCMCKCPDAKFIDSPWHEEHYKTLGTDFRWIYEKRADWWFCPTYVPTLAEFLAHFELLDRHVPTTGFAALLDVLSFGPASVYLTGFDFFASRVHNVNERWKPGDPNDPIGHAPERERRWLLANLERHPITVDQRGRDALNGKKRPRYAR